ncbi:MAG: NAD(P)/FAD-dependent oxidoreductase [Nitrososphaeraceae archaeon]|nr:NAD(P)/FAD-dependent oxidoreductase [Nitrososphaeraceae archaeon]
MSHNKYDYDIIIAGGGLSGLIVATSAAFYSNQSLNIVVIDRNSYSDLGKKTVNGWICGDAVGKNSVDYMTNRIGVSWGSPEIEHPVKGVIAYSPNHETGISFDGDGYILNRRVLPQRQLNDVLKMGIKVMDNIALRSLIADNNYIIGVEGENLKTREVFKKTAKLTIDCTGVTSVLRNNLPINSSIQKKINRDDLESTGRYIYNFKPVNQDKTYFDPDYCIIHLDQLLAPGGYAWVFPKGENKVNIGLGVQQKAFNLYNKKFGTSKNLKNLIDEYVKINPIISEPVLPDGQEDEGNTWGTWQVSVRRQNDCLVANGYMLVGDSAWMPKPLDAGGIGPAIIAATIAGKDAVEAIEASDFSEKTLWKYNKDFINDYGYKTAGLEVFRRLLQTLTNDQIDYGMKYFLSKFDIEKITGGEHPEFGKLDKIGMLIRGALNKTLAEDLKFTSQLNKQLVEHYFNYPNGPDKFPAWKNKLDLYLNEAYSRFK